MGELTQWLHGQLRGYITPSRIHNSHDRNRHTCTYATHTYTWHNWTYTCTHTRETYTYTCHCTYLHMHPLWTHRRYTHAPTLDTQEIHSPTPVNVTHNKLCGHWPQKVSSLLYIIGYYSHGKCTQQVSASGPDVLQYTVCDLPWSTDAHTLTGSPPRPHLTRAACKYKVLDHLFLLYSYMIYLDNR